MVGSLETEAPSRRPRIDALAVSRSVQTNPESGSVIQTHSWRRDLPAADHASGTGSGVDIAPVGLGAVRSTILTDPRRFFLEPALLKQRQYEAPRAFFVEGHPSHVVA